MIEIPLTQGQTAFISDEDYDKVKNVKWHAVKKGDTFYACVKNNGSKTIYMHRVILDAADGEKVDHRDRNGTNNQRDNIRKCTKAENCMNARKPSHGRSTAYKGVVFFKRDGNYRAYIKKDQKQHHLGYFGTPEEGARAYNKAALELFGEFARPNLVPND